LIIGCRDPKDLQRVQKFLRMFPLAWPESSEFSRAYELLTAHRPAVAVSIPDCLIAAMCLARGARLYAFNVKHFQALSGLCASSPYPR
jgi:hypothetical protein